MILAAVIDGNGDRRAFKSYRRQALLGNMISRAVVRTKNLSPGIRHSRGFRGSVAYLPDRRRFGRVLPGCAVSIGIRKAKGR